MATSEMTIQKLKEKKRKRLPPKSMYVSLARHQSARIVHNGVEFDHESHSLIVRVRFTGPIKTKFQQNFSRAIYHTRTPLSPERSRVRETPESLKLLNFSEPSTPSRTLDKPHVLAKLSLSDRLTSSPACRSICTLRQLTDPTGMYNSDQNASGGSGEKECPQSVKIRFQMRVPEHSVEEKERPQRTQIHMNVNDNSVKLTLELPVRHILTFPFLAMQGTIGEALKMGIQKAEKRQAQREMQQVRHSEVASPVARPSYHNIVEASGAKECNNLGAKTGNEPTGAEKNFHRMSKRPRPVQLPISEIASKKSRHRPPDDFTIGYEAQPVSSYASATQRFQDHLSASRSASSTRLSALKVPRLENPSQRIKSHPLKRQLR